jgi:antitoxin component YwqK of YwqJK toxin-antitoxin module
MYTIAIALLSVFLQTQTLDTGYYYFGNTNVIGVGILEGKEKEGEWKVYGRNDPEELPRNSLLQADPKEFAQDFNQESPLYVIFFEKGVPNGRFLENHPNGKPKVITYMTDGVLDGEFSEFYEEGKLHYTGTVLQGKKDGEWTEYLKSGELKTSASYSQGYLDGKSIGYFPDGSVEWEKVFRKGELEGPYAYYLPDSGIKIKGQYANNIPVGEWLEKLEIVPGFYREGAYKNGFKEGEWHLVDSDRKFLQAELYEEGRLISVGKFQLPNPELDRSKVKNSSGKRYFYNEEGQILAKGKISKGVEKGNWYFYFPESNRISALGQLSGSERVGTWYFYSFDGEILDQIAYGREKRKSDSLPYTLNPGNSRSGFPNGVGSPLTPDRFAETQMHMSTMGQFLK